VADGIAFFREAKNKDAKDSEIYVTDEKVESIDTG